MQNNIAAWTDWWVYQPAILVTNFTLWPTIEMTSAQQLNALTRLLFVIVIFLLLLQRYKYALHLLIWGLLTIILTGLLMQNVRRDVGATDGRTFPGADVSANFAAREMPVTGGDFITDAAKVGNVNSNSFGLTQYHSAVRTNFLQVPMPQPIKKVSHTSQVQPVKKVSHTPQVQLIPSKIKTITQEKVFPNGFLGPEIGASWRPNFSLRNLNSG